MLDRVGIPDPQVAAGILLMEGFYTWLPCPWDDRHHPMPCWVNKTGEFKLAGVDNYNKQAWDDRRDRLVGSKFKFVIPNFATGAYCPYPRIAPW